MLVGQKIKINSKDRIDKDSTGPSNFTIELNRELSGTFHLSTVHLPIMYNNINESNNELPFTENGESKIPYLAIGKYAGETVLKTQVLLAWNTASDSNTYSATVDSLTNLFTFTADTLDFSFDFSNTENSCAEILGFLPVDYESSELSLTSSRSYNLSTLQNVNIVINDIEAITDTNEIIDPSFTIPVLHNIGFIQHYVPPEAHPEILIIETPTDTLSIKLVDDQNNEIVFEHEFYFVRKKVRN